MQLHAWDEENHPNLQNPNRTPVGHGVLVWFEVEDYAAVVRRARAMGAEVTEEKFNPCDPQRIAGERAARCG